MLDLLSKLLSGLLPRRRRYLDAAQYNVHPPDLTFLTDVAPGRWVESALDAPFATMGSLVPGGYDAYARVLHPARDASYIPVTWSAVAEWSGRVYHPLMSFEGIRLSADGYGSGARVPRQLYLPVGVNQFCRFTSLAWTRCWAALVR